MKRTYDDYYRFYFYADADANDSDNDDGNCETSWTTGQF